MTAQLAPSAVFRSWDNLGLPLVGGKLNTYQAGTTTRQATYTDSTQSTPNTNPVILNFRGEAFVWLDPTLTYKFVLTDAFNNTIWTEDNIPGSAFVSASGSVLVASNLIPTPTNTWTLGNVSFSWANAYFGPANVPVFDTSSGNIGYYKITAAEIAASVTPTNYAYAPGMPQRYNVKGDGNSDDTVALRNWLAVAAQGVASFGDSTLTCLVTGSISATAAANMNIDARGMTINWPAQLNTSAEVFRINTTTQVDVTLRSLKVQGGRSGTGIGSGSAPFASGIAVYGTNAQNAGAVIISGSEALNTFYAGIEIHYATNARVLECTNVTHNAYAGILCSDNLHTEIDGNQVFDTGNTMITDGYGITSSTSYNSPSAGFNDSVVMSNNRVTNSKRKALDAHSGISVKIYGNKAIGFGNEGIYALCEGVDKQVRDIQIFDNTVEGNASFVASASANAIDVGAFGSALSQQPSAIVRDNKIINLVAAGGINVNNSTTASNGNVQSVDIHGNQFENCSFPTLISCNNNTPGRYRSLNISYNSAISCTLTTQWMNLQKYDNCNVYSNTLAGGTITSTLIGLDDTTKVGIIDNNLQDATPTNVYRKQSFTTNVADGGAITHGMQITPTSILVTPSVTGTIAAVTTIASGTFTVTLKTGAGAAAANQTIYWQAKCI